MSRAPARISKSLRTLTAAVSVAGVAAVALHRRNPTQQLDIRTEVTIAAPVEDVWKTLTDFASYAEWNPFLISMEGTALEGEPLKGVTRLARARTYGFNSTILRSEPHHHLSWGGGSRRILSGVHWLQLASTEDGSSTTVVHGEDWTGILIPLLVAFGINEQRYIDMNEALRVRSEQPVGEPVGSAGGTAA